jgi:hypothetical protein
MNITFQKPVLLAEKKCHSFTLIDVPVFESITNRSSIAIDFAKDCSGQLTEFVESFLLNAAQYFSKQLPVSSFLQRLQHRWNTTEFSQDELHFEGWALLKWIPATVLFYKGYYELEWDLVEIIPQEAFVPEVAAPEHVSPSPSPSPSPPPSPSPFSLSLPLPSPPPMEDIPLQEAEIPPAAVTEASVKRERQEVREAYKQKVRKARLRASLAQLRAEKLAEQYYLRYGNLDMADGESSDSELSFQDAYS